MFNRRQFIGAIAGLALLPTVKVSPKIAPIDHSWLLKNQRFAILYGANTSTKWFDTLDPTMGKASNVRKIYGKCPAVYMTYNEIFQSIPRYIHE